MIVNTAYPFMGKKGPAVNPNIWENGVVNYPYVLSGAGAQWVPNLNRFTVSSPNDVTFTLPLKKFTKIQFNVAANDGSGLLQIYIKGDAAATRQEFNVGYSQKLLSITYLLNTNRTIPKSYFMPPDLLSMPILARW